MSIANRAQITKWFEQAKQAKAEFLIIVCDTFDYEDYPIFTNTGNFDENFERHNGKNMQKIMEIYNLSLPLGSQLKQHRVSYFPQESKFSKDDI